MPRRGGAVAIVGADAMGKANDDPAVANAKRALSATYEGCERQMMRRTVKGFP